MTTYRDPTTPHHYPSNANPPRWSPNADPVVWLPKTPFRLGKDAASGWLRWRPDPRQTHRISAINVAKLRDDATALYELTSAIADFPRSPRSAEEWLATVFGPRKPCAQIT